MRICGGITLYNPSSEQIKNIVALTDIFERIFIFDNSELKQDYLPFLASRGEIDILYHGGDNLGLAKSMNALCEAAFNENFQYICLLDQDSKLGDSAVSEIKHYISSNDDSQVALVVPRVKYTHENFLSQRYKCKYEVIDWAISSGTFVNLRSFNTIGGFEEAYFIDRIDFDFCYRARELGLEIVRVNSATLTQELGRTQFIFKLKFSEHSPLRAYYVFRNRWYFYTRRCTNGVFVRCLKLAYGSVFQILKIIFLESEKGKKIQYIVKAVLDAKLGRFGKYDGKLL